MLWEAAGWTWDPKHDVPHLPVEDLRGRLGPIADFICGSPSEALWMVGVTGTNGKTSCSQWIAHAFAAVGRRAAVIGTLGNGFPGSLTPAPHTTPDAAVLQETLARLKQAGATVVAMEVSSIALDQGRANGTRFDVALFTNLTRDHLDYHGTMAAYGAAKAKLFDWPGLAVAVVNTDDAFGERIAGVARARGARVLCYGVNAYLLGASDATKGQPVEGCPFFISNGFSIIVKYAQKRGIHAVIQGSNSHSNDTCRWFFPHRLQKSRRGRKA